MTTSVRSTAYWIGAIGLVAITAALAWWTWTSLPDRIPTHWNLYGQPNGYGVRATVLWVPGGMALLLLLFRALPWLSPKQFEVDTFHATYLYIMLIVLGLMAYIEVTVLWAETHPPVLPVRALEVGLFGFGALMGNVMGKIRRNFWIGIRTPWTLADERVWDATHRLAGRWMVGGGLIAMGLALVGWPGVALAVFLGSLAVPTVYSLAYSKRIAS
jgi:uncharacterized membrane protein